ncbi:hypothetical protein EKK58_01315 [Candidatus Dependentiae bacterium]|nr:MAG: hypothetical protein EKK58_01315 [Candidatus Dependentiae bacterium]
MDFIVDASFIQFDGFVPVLKTVTVKRTQLVLALQTDAGEVKVTVNKPSSATFPGTGVTIQSGNRYLGTLTFGQGLVNIFTQHLDAVLKLNIPFVTSVVRGVNSKAGVFSLAGYSGDVDIVTGNTPQERALFFRQAGNQVTWNAGWLGTLVDRVPLKSLNKVLPIGNNVFIEDSDLIKITPIGNNLDVSVILPISREVISPAQRYG